jgi:hypothetical protein
MTEHHDHRDDCPFKFATLDVCDCVEKNMLDRIDALTEQLKTVLDREAATTARYDAKLETLTEQLEALTAERDAWKGQHAAEALGLHVQMQRAEAAEAKLAKAVEGLRAFKAFDDMPARHKRPDVFEVSVRRKLLATLAEIEGEKT